MDTIIIQVVSGIISIGMFVVTICAIVRFFSITSEISKALKRSKRADDVKVEYLKAILEALNLPSVGDDE